MLSLGLLIFPNSRNNGVFDEEDLIFRTKQLYTFLDESAKEHGFDRGNVIAIGYSNGANIAASLLFHYGDALKGAILHHPMVPRHGIELPSLTGIPVFITAGQNDPICSPLESGELLEKLNDAGADVSIHWENNGHSLTKTEVKSAAEWYQSHFIK